MKEKIQVSFSGGRTSAYMTKQLIDNYSDKYDFIITFANTSREHPKTLEFVHNCDVHFGFNTVWLEAVVNPEPGKGTTHKVVTFETACRDGSVYESYIKKYGIPNTAFPQCTRELKVRPMESFLKSLEINPRKIPTAIGIRADEARRVSKQAEVDNIIYPLIDWFPTDKTEVIDWWSEQVFDLEIDEFEGNCLGCFKKSFNKHFMQLERDPLVYEWTERMEDLYRDVGPQDGQRVFFRGNRDTRALRALYNETRGDLLPSSLSFDPYANGGCTESCEVYPTV